MILLPIPFRVSLIIPLKGFTGTDWEREENGSTHC